MPFKSIINIRSICPLAETQRPVNANEWGKQGHSSPLQSPTCDYGRLSEVIYWQAMQAPDPQLKNISYSEW